MQVIGSIAAIIGIITGTGTIIHGCTPDPEPLRFNEDLAPKFRVYGPDSSMARFVEFIDDTSGQVIHLNMGISDDLREFYSPLTKGEGCSGQYIFWPPRPYNDDGHELLVAWIDPETSFEDMPFCEYYESRENSDIGPRFFEFSRNSRNEMGHYKRLAGGVAFVIYRMEGHFLNEQRIEGGQTFNLLTPLSVSEAKARLQ